jgi:hypothetical protein
MSALSQTLFALVCGLFLAAVLLVGARCGASQPMHLPEFKVVSFSVVCYLP